METPNQIAQRVYNKLASEGVSFGPITTVSLLEREIKKALADQKQEIVASITKNPWGKSKVTFSAWAYSLGILLFRPKLFYTTAYTTLSNIIARKIDTTY